MFWGYKSNINNTGHLILLGVQIPTNYMKSISLDLNMQPTHELDVDIVRVLLILWINSCLHTNNSYGLQLVHKGNGGSVVSPCPSFWHYEVIWSSLQKLFELFQKVLYLVFMLVLTYMLRVDSVIICTIKLASVFWKQ